MIYVLHVADSGYISPVVFGLVATLLCPALGATDLVPSIEASSYLPFGQSSWSSPEQARLSVVILVWSLVPVREVNTVTSVADVSLLCWKLASVCRI